MALTTTPGSATADSYATLAEFNTYMASRVPNPTWFATATDAQKEAALKYAAILLDSMFAWTGGAVDSTQARAWPRTGMLTRNGFTIPTSGVTSIVTDLKNAQCEFAAQLGAGDRLSDNDALRQGITSVKAGSVAVTFKTVESSSVESADVAIMMQQARMHYLNKTVPDAVRFLLVPSWYTEASVRRPALFGAIG